MSMENEQIIPVQVKYVEAQCAKILKNEKISRLRLRKVKEPSQQKCNAPLLQNGLCQSPIAPEDINVSHGSPVLSPGAGSPTNPLIPAKFQFDPNLTYAEKVAHEMIVTEKIYLDNLKQIIDGFLGPVSNGVDLDVSQENVADLFINVEEIYQFNWVLLQDMEKCNYDPVKLAECFVIKQIGFDIYTKYCTHYPRSMEVLLEWNQREDTANFIKKQQEALGHTLPLCSFLLKPVQRILKYHLLLGNIAKHFKQSEDEQGYEIIQKALAAMTNVAKHINDMKRKHEDAVHLQEIQSVLHDYEGPNLTSFGSLVLEDTFRLHGTKTGRYLFLFEKALLITKRRSDGTFSWKATVMYSNMMLADSVFREPLTFQVIPFDDRKSCYTFVSRDLGTKHVWLLELKKRLLDSYAAAVPMKAKQIILGNGREDCEKENAEPEIVRKSISSHIRKGANQQRAQLNKETSGLSTKLSKNVETDRRKYKDADETLEEKTKTPIDSLKSPLRRKLRVFKKRKFHKDGGKASKRVSWSSDDNNDESYIGKDRLIVNKPEENQASKVSDSEAYDANVEVKENIGEDQYRDNNDNLVSISSLLRDGKTMVSVMGEEDNHLSGQVKLRGAQDDKLPIKKRRLTKEKRQKCKSMPAGHFPIIDEEESFITRPHSMSEMYEKFLEAEVLDSPTSLKELEKYGLVNLKDNTAKAKQLGSYDEELASAEGIIHRSGDVADEVIINRGQSVHQTMKRVSAAFSDISPNFSPEKSPISSTEELTNGDMTAEDLTAGDLTTEEYTAGDLSPEDCTPGDLSPEECVPGSPIPDEVFDGELPRAGSNTGEDKVKLYRNGEGNDDRNSNEGDKENTGENVNSETEFSEYKENGLSTDWNQNGTADGSTYNEDNIYSAQNHENRHSAFQSEPSSYADTLSDSYDEQDDESWSSNFDGSYQRVFSLKRSYSEENLVSKFPLDEATPGPSDVSSKSYTHFDHPSVRRSRSADSSSTTQSMIQPFTFSVTSKKKIVIKDSLWETIKEGAEANHQEIFLAEDDQALTRRRKRKSGRKKGRRNKMHSSDSSAKDTKHIVRTCASLNMADYRHARNDGKIKPSSNKQIEAEPLRTSTKDQSKDTFMSGTTEKTGNGDIGRSHTSNQTGESIDPPLTKIAVALRKRNPKASREKSLIRVDGNMSEVPINYLCIEAFPSDESPNTDKQFGNYTRDVKITNENAASKVERLSRYFDKVTTKKNSDTGRHPKHAETTRKGESIKKRVEELSKLEMVSQKSAKNSEEKLVFKDELNSLQNIQDRIGDLRRSTSDDNQYTKAKVERTSSLNQDILTVKQLKNRIEEFSTGDSGQKEIVKSSNENGLSRRISTSLRIRDRIEELRHNPSSAGEKKTDKNVDEDLRSCKRLQERIARLQKGAKREVDSELDITISDDKGTSNCLISPQQNEELRTVVIKRGWVQQFIQKIETSS